MNRSFTKIRHIQEANRKLEQRILVEKEMNSLIKSVLNEARLPLIQQGDDLCDILCERKQAAYGSNGDVVKLIQNALANCGHNVEFEGGGINQGCKDDYKKCDGKFRRETKKAVESFQGSVPGLVVDGSVGRQTLLALKNQGCIKFDDCDCQKEETRTNDTDVDNEWWRKIGIRNPKYGDCSIINSCISQALDKRPTFSWEDFLKCMQSKIGDDIPAQLNKCSNCPKYSDPKTWGKDYTDKQVFECVKSGCTVEGTPRQR